MMRAIVQKVFGGPEVLEFATLEEPEPGPRDLLVSVKAVAVNPVDSKVRGGGEPGTAVPDGPRVLGWDCSGVVVAIGDQVERFRVGDEVFFAGDIGRPGCYAERVVVDERIVGLKPRSLDFPAAAALPLTSITAWEALLENMRVPFHHSHGQRATARDAGARSSLLIHGGAGGVGSIATQIATRLCDLTVIATASRAESENHCKRMGAHHVINHASEEPLKEQLRRIGVEGVDYVLLASSLEQFQDVVPLLNPLGKICAIVGGEAASCLDVSGLFGIRGTLTFELMFARPRLDAAPESQGSLLNEVARLVDAGMLVSTMARLMSWDQIAEAHRLIESRHTVGKIVLTVG